MLLAWMLPTALVLLLRVALVSAANNGLARLPPMGWRTWNAFKLEVDQKLMATMMDRITDRSRTVDGVPTSLADLGYLHVGLDDGWQLPGAGVGGGFHDADGHPIINRTRFPDMKAMVEYGHSQNLSVDFYMNNCWSMEKKSSNETYNKLHMEGSVKYLFDNKFDGVKLDGCGPYLNLTWWYNLINATGRPMLIENCHWGGDGPPCPGDDCPFNFWRVSGDITNHWDRMMDNLQKMKPSLGDPPLSKPGAWAYPDMLESGKMASFEEDRANFGLWVITSAPLILSFDMSKSTVLDSLWPVIANPEAIAVSQTWAGHPGRLVKERKRFLNMYHVQALPCSDSADKKQAWQLNNTQPGGAKFIVDMVSGHCVDAVDPDSLQLRPCKWGPSQLFQYNTTSLEVRAPLWKNNEGEFNGCFDMSGKVGPRVQLSVCRGQPNNQFTFHDGLWRGGSSSQPSYPYRCMEVKQDFGIDYQVWAKPLKNGAMAVLFLNSGGETQKLNVSLAGDLKLQPDKDYAVRDVWKRQDLGIIRKGDFLATDMLMAHDTRFYKLTPQISVPEVIVA